MKLITQQQIIDYVEENIPLFHQKRLEKLKKLKLNDILKRKNLLDIKQKRKMNYLWKNIQK
ncbi:hypothetical protein GMMP15_290008 [Candidatus Magnetomoraceae bacterium gMMP-15]